MPPRSFDSLTPAQKAQVEKDMNAMLNGPNKQQIAAFRDACGEATLRRGVVDNVYDRHQGQPYTKDSIAFHFSGLCPEAPSDPSVPTLRLGGGQAKEGPKR